MNVDFLSASVADFETTTDEDDCRVWLWADCPVTDPDDIEYGTTIDSFMEYCKMRRSAVFFHNLAFDGKFLLDWLMRNGYKYVIDSGNQNNSQMKNKSFTSLISYIDVFYTITVKWGLKNYTTFYDSWKKIPLSVYNIGHTYELDECKGEIDYRLPRPVEYIPTAEELDYIRRDVQIVAKALFETISAGMVHMTVASDSLAQYRSMIGDIKWNDWFPDLGDDLDSIIRDAYRGGFTWANPAHTHKRLGAGVVFDVNSLYPSVMRNEALPYGVPRWADYTEPGIKNMFATGEGLYDQLWIAGIEFSAKLKKNHVPCIQIHNYPEYLPNEYQIKVEDVFMTLTSVDWKLINEQYDVEFEGVNCVMFFDSKRDMFSDFIDYWGDIKEHSTAGKRYIAKLHLNSLYGKFATNPHPQSKMPVFKDNIVKYELLPEETRPAVYTAVAAFITAYARSKTVRSAQSVYPRFCYADTDSIHLIGTDIPDNLDIHPTRLGAWKHESTFDEAVFLRAKQYAELIDGEWVAHISGMPLEMRERLTPDDMLTGGKFFGKLIPKTVPGGVVLVETSFTL